MTANSIIKFQHMTSKADLEQWLAECDAELEQGNDTGEVWQQRSFCLAQLQRYPEAIMSFQQALSLDPDNPKVWCNYASTLAATGQLADAVYAYDRALDLEPNYANVWRRRAKVLYHQKEYVRAIESYDHALALEPTDARLWYGKGLASYQLGQIKQAIEYFKVAIANDASSPDAYISLAYALIDSNQKSQAFAYLQPWITKGWQDPRLLQCYAYLLDQRSDHEQALHYLEEACVLDPYNVDLWFHRGIVLTRLKRFPEAHEAFRTVLKCRADSTDGWLALGLVLRHLSEPEAAIAAFDKALALSPSHPLAFFHQASCYAVLGRDDWAEEHLRRALSLDTKTYALKAMKDPVLQALETRFLPTANTN